MTILMLRRCLAQWWFVMTCCVRQVLDVRHGQRVEVKETEHMTPTAFIFLYENQLFLTFKHRTVAVWNFRVRRSPYPRGTPACPRSH